MNTTGLEIVALIAYVLYALMTSVTAVHAIGHSTTREQQGWLFIIIYPIVGLLWPLYWIVVALGLYDES